MIRPGKEVSVVPWRLLAGRIKFRKLGDCCQRPLLGADIGNRPLSRSLIDKEGGPQHGVRGAICAMHGAGYRLRMANIPSDMRGPKAAVRDCQQRVRMGQARISSLNPAPLVHFIATLDIRYILISRARALCTLTSYII